MVMVSPSRTTRPLTSKILSAWLILMASAPLMQGLPMPRATTAAWLVMPPWLVSTPWALMMPWMSSGVVSQRTRMTFSPREPRISAVSASKTTSPTAAPGEAGRPLAMTSYLASGSRRGCRSWSSWSGCTLDTASSSLMRPSPTMSTAILRAAAAVRLPVLVCSMKSLPCSMVNSMSCMSR